LLSSVYAEKGVRECTHLDQILDVQPQSTGCQACLDQGDTVDNDHDIVTALQRDLIRHGSVKRVASAVGEGASAIQQVHRYLAGL
jgi:hypothetical protein